MSSCSQLNHDIQIMSIQWTKLQLFIGELLASLVVYSCQTSHNGSLWPKGMYGLPKPKSGCPLSSTWETGLLYQDCEDTNPKTSKSTSFHLAGFVTNDVQKEFCIKTSTSDDHTRPPWPNGQYCIYQKDEACPTGLESGWVIWDDENEIVGQNKNKHNGTLPKGIYNTNTKIYFCCSVKGNKQVEIDLPVSSPFYLLAYRDSQCQAVRGATVAREFIYYETEYYNLVTRNDYGGAHPYRATKNRYGHTIYYCYYTPNYCPALVDTSHGAISPNRCTRANMNVLNDLCSVQCKAGFMPRNGNATTAVCGDDRTWNVSSLTVCIPISTTTNKPTNQDKDQYSSLKPSCIVLKPTHHNEMTHSTYRPTNHLVTWSTTQTDRQGHVINSQAASSSGLSSVGRVVAGAICAAVVAFGVVFFVCVSLCRKDKGNLGARMEKSKSLEELVNGRNLTMNRAISSENLIFADPFIGEVQYTVANIDDNPLYQSLERPRAESSAKTTDNVLYESVSPLILEKTSSTSVDSTTNDDYS